MAVVSRNAHTSSKRLVGPTFRGGGRERSRPILSVGPYRRRFVRDEKKEHFPRVSHTCR